MDPIKEAFSKIKEDIFNLKNEIIELRGIIKNIQQTDNQEYPTYNIQQTSRKHNKTNNQTNNIALEAFKRQNNEFSIGNEGVPTNKQSNQQTVQQTQIDHKIDKNSQNMQPNPFQEVRSIVESLTKIKEEIGNNFSSLTPQEVVVFSSIYTLQEQKKEITYKLLAESLKLSESSIRDYINRLIKKDIPILKTKINNKLVILSISEDLTKNIPLSSVLGLNHSISRL